MKRLEVRTLSLLSTYKYYFLQMTIVITLRTNSGIFDIKGWCMIYNVINERKTVISQILF